MSGSATRSALRAYALCTALGFVAGLLFAVAFVAPSLVAWKADLSAGDVVGGLFNLAAILAVPFVVDALRDKRNREQQLLEAWAAEALTTLRETNEAFEQGLPGPMSADAFGAAKRGIKKTHEHISTIEHALEVWQYPQALRTQVTEIGAEVGLYAHAVGEKKRSADDVRAARAAYATLRKSLVELLPALRH